LGLSLTITQGSPCNKAWFFLYLRGLLLALFAFLFDHGAWQLILAERQVIAPGLPSVLLGAF